MIITRADDGHVQVTLDAANEFALDRLRRRARFALKAAIEDPQAATPYIAAMTETEHRSLCLALRYPDNDDALIGALLRLAR
jgi:hypothetical protein